MPRVLGYAAGVFAVGYILPWVTAVIAVGVIVALVWSNQALKIARTMQAAEISKQQRQSIELDDLNRGIEALRSQDA